MSKRTTTFELALPPREDGIPAYRWLYTALRAEILEGRLRPGARLPATRDLARQYGLSRGTIVNAFEQLRSEGYVDGNIGSGTYVSQVLPEELLHVSHRPATKSDTPPKRKRRLSDYARRVEIFHGLDVRHTRAFRANLPAVDLFPTSLWVQVAAHRLRRVSVNLLLGCEPMGYRPLRQAIADYLNTSRGVKCTADQILVVSGVQEALDLAARLLLNPGDRVCMENPGYIGAAKVFDAIGAKISAIPVDNDGIELRQPSLRGSRLIYITPGHQFPSGITMSLSRRLELLEWARRSGALIFEDDYDGEFRYSGRPVPALQGLDRHGLVLFAGSFSKVLFPSLRLGYLVLPPDLTDSFAATKSITNRHAQLLEQAILTDFILEGHFGRHLRRMRQIYAERLAVLQESAKEQLAGLLEVSEIEAGLQTVGWLPKGIDGEAAAKAAGEHNVDVIPISRFSRGPISREGLQLGFGAVDPKEIRRGIQDLGTALKSLRIQR